MLQPTRHALRCLPSRRVVPLRAVPLRAFSRSRVRFADDKKQEEAPPRPSGQSPYQVFVDTLRSELQKNARHQENVKHLGGEVSKIAGAQWTKGMYEQMKLTASIKNNPQLRAAAEEMRKSGMKVSDAVADAVKSFEESSYYKTGRQAIDRASAAVSSATEPIRSTETYKAVAGSVFEALDDAANNARYGGFVDKETRRRRRESRENRMAALGKNGLGVSQHTPHNPDAGEAVVLHKAVKKPGLVSGMLPESLRTRMDGYSEAYNTSENLFIATARGFTSTVGRLFDENENARVIRWAKSLDPSFQTETFLLELREYIVPEVVDAYISGDFITLRSWVSEATFNVLTASIEPYLKQGLVSESRVLDIRDVDISGARILENDVPVFILRWQTQEIVVFKNPKTGEIAAGSDTSIEACIYAAVITRDGEEVGNHDTGGWKIIDMARRSSQS